MVHFFQLLILNENNAIYELTKYLDLSEVYPLGFLLFIFFINNKESLPEICLIPDQSLSHQFQPHSESEGRFSKELPTCSLRLTSFKNVTFLLCVNKILFK
jgi:hypothetical protein